eukprot:CAMPEP_0184495280 /NCGR_PEP_ID=MMETSP0113_2-20130426/30846_1 /TAXON_ID=91329 /ORGANISM="Norrisiella sphaerica, Strain BC52" /LENGTH=318 /DNA_ID=CAMNT_0026881393 /DNA_START=222 /DNA_END=1178 /DNA_ORIENTATION=+
MAMGDFIDVNGVSTHYTVRGKGNGPLIVIVHGWSSTWEDFSRVIEELSRTNMVVAFDYYGHGYTDGVSRNLDERTLVSFVGQVLLKLAPYTDGMTLKPFTLLGFSMGGPLSSAFALQFPHLIRNLVLINPAGIKVPIPIEGKLVKLPIFGDFLFHVAGAKVLELQVEKGFVDGPRMDAGVKNLKLRRIRSHTKKHPGHKVALLSALRHFRPLVDFEKGFAQLQDQSFEVMVILGKNDEVCKFQDGGENMQTLIPRAIVHKIEDCGHEDVLVKHAKEVSSMIASFANKGVKVEEDSPSRNTTYAEQEEDTTSISDNATP